MFRVIRFSKSSRCLVLLLALSVSVDDADAAPVYGRFQGTISAVTDPQGHFNGSLAAGSPIAGTFLYEPADMHLLEITLDNTYGLYRTHTTTSSMMSLEIGPAAARTVDGNLDVTVYNNSAGGDAIGYSGPRRFNYFNFESVFRPAQPGCDGNCPGFVSLGLQLTDPTAAAFGSLNLPTQVPELGLFAQHYGALSVDEVTTHSSLASATFSIDQLFPILGPELGGVTEIVARTGDATPGDGVLNTIHSPALNNAGQVAFYANVADSADDPRIFRASPAALTQIVRVNQSAPDILSPPFSVTNGQFAILDDQPFINDNGLVAFMASVDETASGQLERGYFRGGTGSLTHAVRENHLSPDGNGSFDTPFLSLSLNNAGQISFEAQVAGTPGFPGYNGVFRGGTTGSLFNEIVTIARPGDTFAFAPGFGDTLEILQVAFPAPALNDAGQLAFRAFIGQTIIIGENPVEALLVGDGNDIHTIATRFQTAPDGNGFFDGATANHLAFGFGPEINTAGEVAFLASIRTNTEFHDLAGVYKGSGGGLTQIARRGNVAPDGDGQFADFDYVALSDSGWVAFNADLMGTASSSTSTGVFRGKGGAVTQIARGGQAAPDGNGKFGYVGFYGPAINTWGVLAFETGIVETSGGTSDNAGIYLSDGIDTLEVARKGDDLDGSTIESSFAWYGSQHDRSGLNDYSQFAYQASLADGRDVVALYTPELHWRGVFSGNWSDAGNWTLGQLPGSPHTVFIDPATYTEVYGPSVATVQKLSVGGRGGEVHFQPSQLTAIGGTLIHDDATLMGSGQIGGDVTVFGTVSPGPYGLPNGLIPTAVMTFLNDVSLEAGSLLEIELAGTFREDDGPFSRYDALDIAGELALAGNLRVSLVGGFTPVDGDVFDILDFASATGTFSSLALPDLSPELAWDRRDLLTTGELAVVIAPPGDFNKDAIVNAADYVAWRNGLGTSYFEKDYEVWRTHFGQTAGSGAALPSAASLSAEVPEPASQVLILLGAVSIVMRRIGGACNKQG